MTTPKRRLCAAAALAIAALIVQAQTNAPVAAGTNAPPMVVDESLTAEVLRVNPRARFVVLSFPLLRMPRIGQRFTVWRTNVAVGELRISGPQRDETIVADIVRGDCQRGDIVRERFEAPPATNTPPPAVSGELPPR